MINGNINFEQTKQIYEKNGKEYKIPQINLELLKYDEKINYNGKNLSCEEYIDFLRATFPEIPIIMVDRGDDACLGWWVKCGHFDITYPLYHSYFKDLRTMSEIIKRQNAAIRKAKQEYPGQTPETNLQLARMLGIQIPDKEYYQNYAESDIKVTVI